MYQIKTAKPVNEKKTKKVTTNKQQQQWVPPKQDESNRTTSGPSLKQIMDEELSSMNKQKQTKVYKLEFYVS